MTADLHLEIGWKKKSYCKQLYYTPPFKVADITESHGYGPLQLMLMSASPGVLDGDQYSIVLNMQPGTALHLQTQSYQRLFTMKLGAAQSMTVSLDKNSSFFFLPHPVVPHAGSNFKTVNSISLADNCELFWSEILTCGRKGCAEIFAFSRYHSVTNIYHNGKLVLKENLLLEPGAERFALPGQWEGYTHQASVIYWNETMDTTALIADLRLLCKDLPGICFGVSALAANGLVLRVLGNAAEQLFDLVKIAAESTRLQPSGSMGANANGLKASNCQ